MVTFLRFVILISIAFILVNLLYILTLQKIDWDFSKTKAAHDFKSQNFKLLVLGNSTAMDGINAEILSSEYGEAYNLALGGASLEVNYVQLQYYLQHNLAPQKVLLFLSSAHMNYTRFNDFNPIVEYLYKDKKYVSLKELPLFKFRWLFIENIKKLFSSAHRNAQVIKGQLRISKITPDNSVAPKSEKECANQDFYNAEGYKYMWRIIQLCKQKGIEINVFEMPCWREFQNSCENIRVSKSVLGDSLSFTLFNLNNRSIYDSTLDSQKDWLSKNHLNKEGAIKLTRTVVRIIRKER